MRSLLRQLGSLAMITLGIAALAFAAFGPAKATQLLRFPQTYTTSGPFLVQDPGGTTVYAVQGQTLYGNHIGVLGQAPSPFPSPYPTNITGVLGQVFTPSSAGVVGYAYLTGYGFYGFAGNGNGAFGATQTATGPYAGMVGDDESTAGTNYGVFGETVRGYGVYGTSSTGYGIYGVASGTGTGGYFSSDGTAGGVSYLAKSTGEGGAFYGHSGNATHPALVAVEATPGTDLIGTYNASSVETFIAQAGTANYSGYAVSPNGSDVQVSGDLYVQGNVFYYCSANSGTFPVTAPHGHCMDSPVNPVVKLRTTSGSSVAMYHSSQTAATVEDFGEAQLVNGQSSVSLNPSFASTIDPTRSYLVFITPEGENHGLYVAGKSIQRFVVRETMGGHSSIAFQYRIVAHPYADGSGEVGKPPSAATVASRRNPSIDIAGARRPPAKIKLATFPTLYGTGIGAKHH